MAQTPKTSATDKDQMEEASQVLTQYLELFSYDCHQFKFYFNANSVVDWFGRSVRGPAKIHEYLSKDIGLQYEHIEFEKAEPCGPIEHKPTHMKTKIASTMEMDFIHPRNRVSGITHLKNYAESDMEDDEDVGKNVEMMRLSSAAVNKTPEKQKLNTTVIEDLTPPASNRKPEDSGEQKEDDDEVVSATASEGDNNDDDNDEGTLMPSRAKRFKRTHLCTPFSYLRRLPTGRKLAKSDDEDSSSESSDAEAYTNKKNIKKNVGYTPSPPPLHYLEATGVLRRKRALGSTSPSSGDSSWEREVRLRISYRRRVHSADRRVEFALVTYEHLSAAKTPMRRNLCADFSRTLATAAAAAAAAVDDDALDEQEQPALVLNEEQTTVVSVATVATPNTDEIAAALETAAFTIVPLRTPTKAMQTPPATPKRRPRLPASSLKRFNLSPSTSSASAAGAAATTTPPTPKRSAARSLRL